MEFLSEFKKPYARLWQPFTYKGRTKEHLRLLNNKLNNVSKNAGAHTLLGGQGVISLSFN